MAVATTEQLDTRLVEAGRKLRKAHALFTEASDTLNTVLKEAMLAFPLDEGIRPESPGKLGIMTNCSNCGGSYVERRRSGRAGLCADCSEKKG